MKHTLFQAQMAIFFLLVGWGCANPLGSQAANASVSIGDDFFSPPSSTINVNEQVTWTWVGNFSHSSTSDAVPALWDSGINANGHTFSQTFASAGIFPYHCSVHLFQKGTITVQSAQSPPSATITAPKNGATFAAPWTGTIQATNSATGGATVSKVDFFANASYLGTVSNPPAIASFTVTNLPAGNYTLTALATDNRGATNTSAGVAITVVTPTAINVSAPQRVSPTSFQFSYSAVPGLRYVVLRSGTVTNLFPISTNTAANASEMFLDTNASGAANFYRVQVAPNP